MCPSKGKKTGSVRPAFPAPPRTEKSARSATSDGANCTEDASNCRFVFWLRRETATRKNALADAAPRPPIQVSTLLTRHQLVMSPATVLMRTKLLLLPFLPCFWPELHVALSKHPGLPVPAKKSYGRVTEDRASPATPCFKMSSLPPSLPRPPRPSPNHDAYPA